MKTPKNISASVRQRLLNISRNEKRPFQEVLQYYAMDRFLYRLSQSPFVNNFILKGAFLLRVWDADELRPTMDIDLAGQTSNDEKNIEDIFRKIIKNKVLDDGLVFLEKSVTTQPIKEDSEYQGVRVLFIGQLDSARINMQIDVGFNDIIFPSSEEQILPSILDFPASTLKCYSKETVIGEKFETIVKLGYQNSRMKDFYDIWLLSRQYNFKGSQLSEAVKKIFNHRMTSHKGDILAFESDFQDIKKIQWNAFIKKLKQDQAEVSLDQVLDHLKLFLKPIIDSLNNDSPKPEYWHAPGPWEI